MSFLRYAVGVVLATGLTQGCSNQHVRSPEPRNHAESADEPRSGHYPTMRAMKEFNDPTNGSQHMVLEGVELRSGKTVRLSTMLSTVISHTFITARAAGALGAVDLGEVELPPGGSIGSGAVDEPAHLRAVYGMNPGNQRRFRKVRIDRVDLGVGPSFGPVEALVLDDANTSIGAVGRDWLSHREDDKGYIIAAGDTVYFGKIETRETP